MNMTCPEIPPAFPPPVIAPVHAELAITHLGALVGVAGSMIDLAAERTAPAADAQDKAAAVRRSLAEGPELLATLTGRRFEAIVEEFVYGARMPAADGSCRAAALLERIVQAAQ